MPANADPTPARIHDDGVVHIQSHNRRPTHGGQADEQRPWLVPLEMLGPGLLAGMKQEDRLSRQWVRGAGGAAFIFIAAATGKAEVFKGGFTASYLGDDVINGHRLTGVSLGSVAVGAVAIVGFE